MKDIFINTIFLLILSVNFAFAQGDFPSPKSGQSYPTRTILQAVCKPALAHEVSTWTDFQWWDEKRGGWNSFTPAIQQGSCHARFNTPGKYRMVVITGRFGNPDQSSIVAEFTIGKPTPCDAKANQIIVIKDGNGRVLTDEERKAAGLEKDSFMSGQTVKVPNSIEKGIEIKFYDDSILRVSSGSSFAINQCSDLAPLSEPLNIKITLLLGKIWAKITPENNTNWNIQTERAVDGNRGTTFSTEYNPVTKTTTVIVEEGSAWLKNRFGKVKTIIINAGETGTQTMNQPPVLKKN